MADDIKLGIEFHLNNRSSRQIADAVGNALNQASKAWSDQIKEDFARGIAAGAEYAARSGKGGSAIQSFLQSNITDVYSKFYKELQAGNLKEAAKLDKLLDKRTRRFEREVQAQTDAWEAMQKRSAATWAEKADKFKDTIENVNRSMHMKDPSGYLNLGRQLGGRIQEGGRARQEQAERLKKRGDISPEAAEKMSKRGAQMAAAGASLATIAALAAAVLALIKLFMDLNDRIVDMNKSILQTGSISDMGIGGRAWEAGHKFRTELKQMRGEILDASSELGGFRVSADEMFAAVGALNEYGRGFEKIKDSIADGTKNLQNYGDAAENVVAYAKLMGMSTQEMGHLQSKWANDFGQDMTRVYEGLSAVRQEAVQSGFSMKRFIGTVAEAATGMGAYAVRVEEAGKVLKFLGNQLGETAGTELFKSLTNTFTEMGASDRVRRVLTTGQDEMQRIMADQATANATSLLKDFEREGVGFSGVGGASDLVKALAGLDEQGREKMIADLRKDPDVDSELIQRLDNLVETSKAGQGDLGAMVNAMSDLGPAGTLATLTQNQVFGGMRLHEFAGQGVAQRAAAEQMTGMSGKAFESLVDASRATSSDMGELRRIQKQVLEDGRTLSKEEQMGFAELYGATVTQTGQIVGATADLASNQLETGAEIVDETGLMLAQNDRYKKAEEAAVSEDIKLAREVAHNTEKLANVMESNMLKWLEKIYNVTNTFWMDFLRLIGKEDPGAQARLGAANRLSTEAQKIHHNLAENNKWLEQQKEFIETTDDPIMKKGAQEQTKAIIEANSKLEEMLEVNDLAKDLLANMDTEGMTQVEVMRKLSDDLSAQGYDIGINTLDENAARNFTLQMKEEMDNVWPSLADAYEDAADDGQFGATAGTLGFQAAKKAGITDTTRLLAVSEAARQAAEQQRAGGADWEEAMPAMEQAINTTIMKMAQESPVETLMQGLFKDMNEIARNTNDAAEAAKDNNARMSGAGGGASKAGDFLIRPGQKPIITDPNDTIMGFKPGGAFGIGGGGGGGGGAVVNIYGGDLNKVYNEVMRVMKVLGHA